MDDALKETPDDRFAGVQDPNHDPNDNDCLCDGCLKVLDQMAREGIHEL